MERLLRWLEGPGGKLHAGLTVFEVHEFKRALRSGNAHMRHRSGSSARHRLPA